MDVAYLRSVEDRPAQVVSLYVPGAPSGTSKTISLPALNERGRRVDARPFVKGGFKMYASDSVFFVTEWKFGLGDGVHHVLAVITSALPASAQTTDYWLRYPEQLQIGSTIRVRTTDGKRTTAVLAIVDDTGITIEPKTRRPEPPRHIPFDQLAQIELKEHGGMGGGKAAAIGVATGAGTFFGILLILLASWD